MLSKTYSPAMSLIVTSPFGKAAVRENGDTWAMTGMPSYVPPLIALATVSASTLPMKSRIGVSSTIERSVVSVAIEVATTELTYLTVALWSVCSWESEANSVSSLTSRV